MPEIRVSLVIPGRNSARTLRTCLTAAREILTGSGALQEIVFVDDGSSDNSAAIAREMGVKVVGGPAGGPGAARNAGWRAAACPLIWFIDSDCVARPDALDLLMPYMKDPSVGGVGGSYDNMVGESTLASLIHEEIALRHRRMSDRVNFLGGFNVLYRREALERAGGFDEHLFNGPGSPGAEDAELSWRVQRAGYGLRFEPASRVAHYHPTRLGRYLRSQRHHGYWRVFLHLKYPRRSGGDDYSSLVDHLQPPLALAALVSIGLLVALPGLRWMPAALAAILLLAQLPITLHLVGQTGRLRYLLFAPLGFVRAFARAIGMAHGMVAYPFMRNRSGKVDVVR